jgi:hypothetical protein
MRRGIIGVALLIAAGALGADVAIDTPANIPPPARPNTDASIELKWDTGTLGWSYAWYTGLGSWVGVDFNIATLTTYRLITHLRLYCRAGWPNSTWEGSREAVYAISGMMPGSMLWGPMWFKPTISTNGFQDFGVGWTLPVGQTRFILAVEQCYNYPNADAYTIDNNHTTLGHSWEYHNGGWYEVSNDNGYNNLMIRAVVDDVNNTALEPASLGRVKATYY